MESERREAMTKHKTGTSEEWLAARLELLKAEKDLSRRSDELAERRVGAAARRHMVVERRLGYELLR
jgi:predicted dithiol-disulfide oxidoreductase (DUF899 family)